MATLRDGKEFTKVVGIGNEVCSISLTFDNLNERYVRSLRIPFQCYVRVPFGCYVKVLILVVALFVLSLLNFSALVLVDGFLSLQRLC